MNNGGRDEQKGEQTSIKVYRNNDFLIRSISLYDFQIKLNSLKSFSRYHVQHLTINSFQGIEFKVGSSIFAHRDGN